MNKNDKSLEFEIVFYGLMTLFTINIFVGGFCFVFQNTYSGISDTILNVIFFSSLILTTLIFSCIYILHTIFSNKKRIKKLEDEVKRLKEYIQENV